MAPVVPVTTNVAFDPAGKPLTVRLAATPALPGHYSLKLLDADRFTVIKDYGNVAFSTPAANTHDLPGTAADQVGRILHAVTSVGIVDRDGSFNVSMTVLQRGLPLPVAAVDSGTRTQPTAESELNSFLIKDEAVGGEI
ncbi:MAG: hypothetical protein ABI625_12335 [bacterium]